MNLEPRYSGSRRPGDAENFVRHEKKRITKREKGDVRSQKKIGKMRCKVAKNEKNPGQRDNENALH